tara:strand:+ start:36 stop:878 length:843 start_codon:yes stop_codon:yes gene_type:complete
MRFSIIGPSGYIGIRHLDAIEANNGEVISYLDIKEYEYLSKKSFYKDEEIFFKSLKKDNIDFCVICSPNYLHYKHIISSLRSGVDVICEKPLCIKKEELLSIEKTIEETENKVYSIMQLRLHPVFNQLKNISEKRTHNKTAKIKVISPRDKSYLESWKTKRDFSGGILFNLGIHYFDLLINAFGYPKESNIISNEEMRSYGTSVFESLKVDWFFSIDPEDQDENRSPQRVFEIDGEEITFHHVSTDLHHDNYKEIIENSDKFSFKDIKSTIEYMLTINEK